LHGLDLAENEQRLVMFAAPYKGILSFGFEYFEKLRKIKNTKKKHF
jgi:hypothetical protein